MTITVEQYKDAARKAAEAGDITTARKLIARAKTQEEADRPSAFYENVVGYGEVDTPGERLGATLNDMGKSLGSGVARGVTGLVTLPHTIGGLMDSGFEKMTGIDPNAASALPNAGLLSQRIVDETVGGYDPTTTAGEFTGTIGEFLPGVAMGASIPAMVASGVGSEAAGQLTEGSKYEGLARFGGAMLGPAVATAGRNAVSRVVSPNAGTPPERLKFAQDLADEGISLTAGQKTGNNALKYREALLPKMQDALEEQGKQFTRAAMKRVGVDGLATPENMIKANGQISDVFKTAAKTVKGVNFDKSLVKTAKKAVAAYKESVGVKAALPGNILKKIKSGKITGKDYNDFSSRLGEALKSNDSALRNAAGTLRGVIDDALIASAPKSLVDGLKTAKSQYRDFLAIERAVGSAGEKAAYGVISPAQLRTSVKTQGVRGYTQGKRELGDLARAGTGTMGGLPQSGTQPRMAAQLARSLGPLVSGGGAGGLVGGLLGGPVGAGIGAGAGVMLPGVANMATASRAGQKYLANQLMPRTQHGGLIDIMRQAAMAGSNSR